jgi:hypothetical protein
MQREGDVIEIAVTKYCGSQYFAKYNGGREF